MRPQNPLRPGWSSLGGLRATAIESQFLRSSFMSQRTWAPTMRFRGLGDMTAPFCAAAAAAAASGITIYSDGSAVLVAPHVVIAASYSGFSRRTASSTYPGYAVVLRAEAQQRGVPIAWDPWPGRAANSPINAGGAHFPADITSWTAPDGCRDVVAAPTPGAALGPAIATGLGIGLGRIVLGVAAVVGLGAAAYFVFRD